MGFTVGLVLLIPLLAQISPGPEDWRAWLNKGVEDYRTAKYDDAVAHLQKAADAKPSEVVPHLYLGMAWMHQYIPGAKSSDNEELSRKAEAEFQRVLELDPRNEAALSSLATLTYMRAGAVADTEQKSRMLDEAAAWYEKVIEVNPRNKEAYYSLGVIAWGKYYPKLGEARARLGMQPEDPGPLRDSSVRGELNASFGPVVEQGISNLEKALEIDPKYDEAMAYMNLLVRERADLRDTAEDYQRDIETADMWLQKTLETRKEKAKAGVPRGPLSGSGGGGGGGSRVTRIYSSAGAPNQVRIAPQVQNEKLLEKVEPVYPAAARDSNIEGTVLIDLIIGRDGRVRDAEVAGGHPLLAPAALDAVRRWVYKPTLLNGQPVEVVTTAAVNFTLNRAR